MNIAMIDSRQRINFRNPPSSPSSFDSEPPNRSLLETISLKVWEAFRTLAQTLASAIPKNPFPFLSGKTPPSEEALLKEKKGNGPSFLLPVEKPPSFFEKTRRFVDERVQGAARFLQSYKSYAAHGAFALGSGLSTAASMKYFFNFNPAVSLTLGLGGSARNLYLLMQKYKKRNISFQLAPIPSIERFFIQFLALQNFNSLGAKEGAPLFPFIPASPPYNGFLLTFSMLADILIENLKIAIR